jgi:RNA polymerase sigma-70 factor (ECF subfamily)
MSTDDSNQRHLDCLARIAAGGTPRERAVLELHDEFFRLLTAFFRRSRIDAMQAEDLTQDVLVRVVNGARDFRSDAKVSTWIWSIARNRLIDHLRASKPELLLDDDGWAVVEEQHPAETPDQAPHSLERCVELAFMRFAKVCGERAEALRRVALDGCPVEEVAVYLGRTVRATHEFLSQSRKKFRPFLEDCHEFLAA